MARVNPVPICYVIEHDAFRLSVDHAWVIYFLRIDRGSCLYLLYSWMKKELTMPAHLVPRSSEPEVQVPIELTASRSYDAEAVDRLQTAMGLIKIDGNQLKALSDFGLAAKSLGIASLIYGGAMITVQELLKASAFAGLIVADPTDKYTIKQKAEMAKLQGYLAGQLARVNTSATKVETAQAQVIMATDRKMRQSHPPGVTITLEPEKKA